MSKKNKKQLALSVAWKGNKVYEALCTPISDEYELTQNEIDVLAFLENFNELNTAKEISKYRVISKSLICKSVKSLVNRGFLRSEQDEGDKRVQHLFITQKADDIVKKIILAQDTFMKTMYSGITPEEDKVLTGILNKIIANLESVINTNEKQ